MIRRKLSNGLLRATAHAQAPHVASPARAGVQSANLASAVMLNSTRNWKTETIVTLKAELKRRGLSQTGNKATLIDRLSSAETSSQLGPVPSLPPTNRQLSTTRSRAQPPKSTAPASTSTSTSMSTSTSTSTSRAPPKAAPVEAAEADTEQLTSAGPAVSSQKTDVPSAAPVRAEQVTVTPGLPETADVGKTRYTLDIKMPQPQEEELPMQSIPFTPDNYRSNATLSAAESAVDAAEAALPKVMTVASASTHPAGGPTHGLHSASDAHAHEVSSDVAAAAQSFPSFTSTVSALFFAPVRAASSTGLVPTVRWPKRDPKASEYTADPSAPLSDDERTGAWVLAGIVGLGLLLGGPHERKRTAKGGHGAQHDGAAAGTIGDVKWQQASGANIVGHGERKD